MMAVFSGSYLLAFSNYPHSTIFKSHHPHAYSKHFSSLNLDFSLHRKARMSYIASRDDKTHAAPRAEMSDAEQDQLQQHLRQADVAYETGSKHQVLSHTNSRVSHQSRLRVAYQGISGAYSELAAERAYPNCETIPCRRFDTTFEVVECWVAERAIIPIENSIGGSIHGNYDLLVRHNLHIIGELQFAISHCLLANNGVKFQDLKTVLSHSQALAQCEKTLARLGLVGETVINTAVAAKQVSSQNLRDTGALASSSAAQIYGLNILAPNIQDEGNNVTRFLVLARDPLIADTEKPFKTSLVFSLHDGPAVLPDALSVFTSNQIKLLKIESRPMNNQPLQASKDNNSKSKTNGYFNYLFYADLEASMADQRAQIALTHLKELSTFVRVLGSYPMNPSIIYE